jgi:hypothetical protein
MAQDLDLGKLLRLKGMVESAASAVDPAQPESAHAITDSYQRLRAQVGELVGGSDLEGEFTASFPEIDVARFEPRRGSLIAEGAAALNAAQRARVLLGQLAGWLEGLIVERTLQQRIEAEAAERVKQERKQPPGFRATP